MACFHSLFFFFPMIPKPYLLLVGSAVTLGLCSCSTPTDRSLFLEADKDSSGTLTLAEVNAVGLPRVFASYDVDGSGKVTLADMKALMPDFDEALFKERDLNGDGVVTYEEYYAAAMAKGGLKAQFDAVDANGDGVVDRSEADAYVAQMELKAAANGQN